MTVVAMIRGRGIIRVFRAVAAARFLPRMPQVRPCAVFLKRTGKAADADIPGMSPMTVPRGVVARRLVANARPNFLRRRRREDETPQSSPSARAAFGVFSARTGIFGRAAVHSAGSGRGERPGTAAVIAAAAHPMAGASATGAAVARPGPGLRLFRTSDGFYPPNGFRRSRSAISWGGICRSSSRTAGWRSSAAAMRPASRRIRFRSR